MSMLDASGLTMEQRLHFSEHGWVLLEEVFDAERCRAYIDAIDRDLGYHGEAWETATTVHWLSSLHLYGSIYLEWLRTPGVVEANRQLIDVHEMRVDGLSAAKTDPHPDRHDRREAVLDTTKWGWHRDFDNPKNMLRTDPDDPRLLYATDVVNVTYLTPMSPENGSTAFFDKSHIVPGSYDVVKEQCEVIQPEGPAGSMVIFAESLMHTGTPVVSETPRYALFYDFIAPWFAHNGFYELPKVWQRGLRDADLRELFASPDRVTQAEVS
jgi:hypothetical protein